MSGIKGKSGIYPRTKDMMTGKYPRTEKHKGNNANNFRGGKIIDKNGYIYILKPEHPYAIQNKRYVFEHRLIIEKQIGRYLHRWEVSHHINGIKDDNRPENLMAFKNNIVHKKFEFGKKINPQDIIFDGSKI